MTVVLCGLGATLVGVYLFFQFFVGVSFGQSLGATLATLVFTFLFTSVSVLAIALVARNPISGMTLFTIFVTGTVFLEAGLSGPLGMRVTLLIACIVCTALSTSGGFITDLKAGYWLGTTPRKQELLKIPAVVVAAVSTALAIHFIELNFPAFKGIAAPQANLMATMTGGIMSGEEPPYYLYAMGVGLTLVLEFLQVGAMTFALGMYLPMELNTPALVGGIIAHYVRRSSPDPEVGKKRWDRGTLIASGLIAGGALISMVGVALKYFGTDQVLSSWVPHALKEGGLGEIVSIVAFTLLCVWLYRDSKKAA
jgi:putative OPT family oligopeptide transporter